jgi:hypothetical protein
MAETAELTGYADVQAVIDALDLAGTAVQPEDDAADLGSGTATNGHVLTADGDGGAAWEAPSGGEGGGAGVTISDTAPSTPTAGDLWFDSTLGVLLIYYDDGDTEQWVSTAGGL